VRGEFFEIPSPFELSATPQPPEQQVYSRKSATLFNTHRIPGRYSHECQRIARDRRWMEGMEMTNHCNTTAPAAFGDDQVAPLRADGGEVVRYRLEASEVEWELAPGRTVRGYGFNDQVPGPVLEAKPGVPLEIEFTNRLPEPT
jgi:hypothetical protein